MKINFMNIHIEDYLHSIDAIFKEKVQKDIYMTYVMIFTVIFAFSYLLFWDSSFASFEKTRASVVSLDKKIMSDNKYLQLNPESVITRLDAEIKKITIETIMHKDNNAYIKTKIETISSLIYDERAWGEYLDSISKNAQIYGIKILNFTNKYAALNSSFGHVLDITVQSTGKYKNTLQFINSLEKSNLVVDIHQLNIKADKELTSDLNISVWGITY